MANEGKGTGGSSSPRKTLLIGIPFIIVLIVIAYLTEIHPENAFLQFFFRGWRLLVTVGVIYIVVVSILGRRRPSGS